MSTLAKAVEDYLSLRRKLGYKVSFRQACMNCPRPSGRVGGRPKARRRPTHDDREIPC